MSPWSPRPLSRRRLLGAGVGLAAGAVLAPTLTGCRTPGTAPTITVPPIPGPTYTALANGPKPAIRGNELVPDTFYRYPDQPTVSVPRPPGDGRPVRILTVTYAPIPPTPPINTAWVHLERQLGSPLQIQPIPVNDYPTKFNTTAAGGRLPDMMTLPQQVADLPDLVDALCLDLSDHLSGDNIRRYPNLAAIPTDAWEAGRFNGRLYGLPSPRGAMSSGLLCARLDLLRDKGVQAEFDSFEELLALAKELNDPKAGRWAFTIVPHEFIKQMLGIPNFWRYDGSTMLSRFTAPECERSLEAQTKIVKGGLMNPDAFAKPDQKGWFRGGKAYFNPDSFSSWAQYMGARKDDLTVGGTALPAFDGPGSGNDVGHQWLSFPSFGRSVISKDAADRVEVLLGVADYLAAPFGSREYLDVHYGQPEADYALKDGVPALTSTGSKNVELGLKYLTDAKQVNFIPGYEDVARDLDRTIRRLGRDAYANDAVYLPSPTADRYFDADVKAFRDLEDDVVLGRRTLADYRAEADSWWSARGRAMSEELTRAYQEAGRG